MKINFNSQGTDKLLIGRQAKMGLGSLDTLPLRQYYVLEENQTAVVLIRDVIDKWRSGYKQELQEMLYNSPYLINFIEPDIFDEGFSYGGGTFSDQLDGIQNNNETAKYFIGKKYKGTTNTTSSDFIKTEV